MSLWAYVCMNMCACVCVCAYTCGVACVCTPVYGMCVLVSAYVHLSMCFLIKVHQ